jgi:hypothetical protein
MTIEIHPSATVSSSDFIFLACNTLNKNINDIINAYADDEFRKKYET